MEIMEVLNPLPLVALLGLGVGIVAITLGYTQWRENRVLRRATYRSWWQFTSGGRGHQFFDVDAVLTTPEGGALITNWISGKITELERKFGRPDKLIFIEKDSGPVGMVIAMTSIVEKTGIPGVVVRLRRKVLPGMIKQSPSAPLSEGETAIVVTDVTTSGRSAITTIDRIHEVLPFKTEIPYVLTVFDQNKGARAELGEKGIELISRV